MKILIAVASKHGATAGIGKIIERTLAERGHEPHFREPSDVDDLSMYDAVILGSAIYAGNWRRSARKFAAKHGQELLALPLWVFSSGPLGLSKDDDEYTGPVIENLVAQLEPVEHKVFSGKLDPSQLNLGEKAIIKMVKAPQGDYRSFNEIVDWAKSISDYLSDME